MEINIIYSEPKQLENYILEDSWNLLDENSVKTRKKAYGLKGAIAAKMTPVVIIKDKDKYIKVFYKEEFKDPINEFINWYYANQSN
jgi:hypothetical protein